MERKIPMLCFILGCALILAAAMLFSQPAQTASAQCKNPSTCKNCHEVQGQHPVNTQGKTPGSPASPWHAQHASFDFCAVCHGGDKTAQDAATAHANMTTRLNDMAPACKNCHEADLDTRFAVYASQLGVTDTSALDAARQNSNALSGASSFMGEGVAAVDCATPTPIPVPEGGNQTGNGILTGLLILGVFGGGGYVTWNERRLRASQPENKA